MARSVFKPGTRLGNWQFISQLNAGGNGRVWKVRNGEGALGALKLLRKPKTERSNIRFSDEIRAMRACQDIPGVLPLLDDHIPDNPTRANPAWLVSALATPLDDAIVDIDLIQTVRLVLSLARTLAKMHERGYSHRDIKPGNIFLYNDYWCLGDFGLVDFPEKQEITETGEKLGPLFYIAPEMLNAAKNADGSKADVYSLGKLLWKLATGQTYPLQVPHRRDDPATTISANVRAANTAPLDALLEAMTQSEPDRRPTSMQIAGELEAWLAPPAQPTRSTDLAPFTKRAMALLEPYVEIQRRRSVILDNADRERKRAFDAFSSVMKQIKAELERAKIGRVYVEGPSGGNALFYRAVIGGYADGVHFYQYSVGARIEAGGKMWGSLMSGLNLGIRHVQVDDGVGMLPDIFAPVLTAAGYIVRTEILIGGSWQATEKLIWGDHDTILLGQPRESEVLTRLASGLMANLSISVASLLEAMEAPKSP